MLTDDELLQFALSHSKTEFGIARFHRNHVIRIWGLAGLPLRELFDAFPDADGQVDLLPMFIAVRYENMKALVCAARDLQEIALVRARTEQMRHKSAVLEGAQEGAWAGENDPIGPYLDDEEAPSSGLRDVPPLMTYPCAAAGGCPSHNHVPHSGLVCKECLH